MDWTIEEIKYLKNNYKNKTNKEVCEKLGRTVGSVRNKALRLDLSNRDRVGRAWSDEELKIMIEWYSKKGKNNSLNLNELARKLNRAETLVCKKAKSLGLTNMCREKSTEQLEKLQKGNANMLKTKGHPKGMLGKKHSKDYCKKISERVKKEWQNPDSKYNSEEHRRRASDRMMKAQANNKISNPYSRTKSGKRSDLNNMFFRSSWEANYARYLNLLIKEKQIYDWGYEVDRFVFEGITRGNRSYCPDFKIWETKNSEPYYVEIKGWLDNNSKVKLKRMSKYYPEIKLEMVQQKEYDEIKKKVSMLIENWED